MGPKLGAPEKLGVNIMDAAAIGMSGMDIEMAVRHQVPIMTIVLNDHVLSGYSVDYPYPQSGSVSLTYRVSTPT